MSENICKTYLVKPVTPTLARLFDTNAVNAESAWVPGSYNKGEKVTISVAPTVGSKVGVVMNRVFQSLEDLNTSMPGSDPLKWQNIGPSNRVAMFTNRISEFTERAGGLNVVIEPKKFVSCVAFFGLQGTDITLTVRTAAGGVRSTETKQLINRPDVVDLVSFFFAEFVQTRQAIFLPITCLPDDKLEVAISGNARCSRMIFGSLTEIGSSPNYGATWELDDYTSSDPDEFGIIDPVVRDYAPRNNVSIYVNPESSNFVLSTLIELRGIPVLFIGSTSTKYLEAMLNFGLVKSPRLVLEGPTHTILDFELKGYV